MRHWQTLFLEVKHLTGDTPPPSMVLSTWEDDLPADPEHLCSSTEIPESEWCKAPKE